MEFKTNKDLSQIDLLALYESVGWTSYTKDPMNLQQAVYNSTAVISAWQDNELIGLTRGISDCISILYIQDLLVKPEWQTRKVGTRLLTSLMNQFPNVRQTVLLTDNTKTLQSFYEQSGFKRAETSVMGYYHFK